MKATGIVTETYKDYATVVSERISACSSCRDCSERGSCHAELIFGDSQKDVKVTAKNTLNAKCGDKVELESSTFVTLLSAFLVFVLPFFEAALFCYLAFPVMSVKGYFPLYVILIFCIGFVISGIVVNAFIKKKHSIYIVKVLEES